MGDWIDRNAGTRVALAGVMSESEDQALIRDDRVLNRAYEVFGDIPEVKRVDVGESVPQEAKAGLAGMVSRSD